MPPADYFAPKKGIEIPYAFGAASRRFCSRFRSRIKGEMIYCLFKSELDIDYFHI